MCTRRRLASMSRRSSTRTSLSLFGTSEGRLGPVGKPRKSIALPGYAAKTPRHDSKTRRSIVLQRYAAKTPRHDPKTPNLLSLQDKIRPLWRHYFTNTQGLIFVVDSNDRDRYPLSSPPIRGISTAMNQGVHSSLYARSHSKPNCTSALQPCRFSGKYHAFNLSRATGC